MSEQTKERAMQPEQVIAFLRSVIRCGEQLNDSDNQMVAVACAEIAAMRQRLERLDEIKAGADADAADLAKMRDGTKLTRDGVVSILVYQQQDIRELKVKNSAATAEIAALRAKVEAHEKSEIGENK